MIYNPHNVAWGTFNPTVGNFLLQSQNTKCILIRVIYHAYENVATLRWRILYNWVQTGSKYGEVIETMVKTSTSYVRLRNQAYVCLCTWTNKLKLRCNKTLVYTQPNCVLTFMIRPSFQYHIKIEMFNHTKQPIDNKKMSTYYNNICVQRGVTTSMAVKEFHWFHKWYLLVTLDIWCSPDKCHIWFGRWTDTLHECV